VTHEPLPRPSDPQTDATALPGTLESLGFTFGEESPATQPVEVPLATTSSAPPLSRRAMREAEKQSSGRRRGFGANRAERPASSASTAPSAADEGPTSAIEAADIATAPMAAIEVASAPEAPRIDEPADTQPHTEFTPADAVDASSTLAHPAATRTRRSAQDSSAQGNRAQDSSVGGAVAPRPPAAAPAVRAAAPTTRVSLRRRAARKAFPPVVMAAAAALLIGTSVPPSALFDPDAPPASAAYASIPTNDAGVEEGGELSAAPELDEGQVLEMAVTEDVAAPVASRDDWSVTSYAEMLRLKYGTRDFSYSTTGEGAVRWPFPFAVPVSSGFGERVAPCRGCSSYHRGLDLIPGRGTPVYAIAEGVVTGVGGSSTYGYRVEVEHVINGQKVTSLYAHLEWDSSPLAEGEQIPVGTFLGTVGNSGLSTGPHLHLEIHIDDIPIDPFAWLTTNAA